MMSPGRGYLAVLLFGAGAMAVGARPARESPPTLADAPRVPGRDRTVPPPRVSKRKRRRDAARAR